MYRYVREGVDVLAALAPTLDQALDLARRKAFVILDGTLLVIDRVAMASGRDRAFYSGKHKRHGVNVQVIADPAGRLVWASPALPGARHDMGAARERGLIDALNAAEITTIADTAYQGGGPEIRGVGDPQTYGAPHSWSKPVNAQYRIPISSLWSSIAPCHRSD